MRLGTKVFTFTTQLCCPKLTDRLYLRRLLQSFSWTSFESKGNGDCLSSHLLFVQTTCVMHGYIYYHLDRTSRLDTAGTQSGQAGGCSTSFSMRMGAISMHVAVW